MKIFSIQTEGITLTRTGDKYVRVTLNRIHSGKPEDTTLVPVSTLYPIAEWEELCEIINMLGRRPI